MSHGRANSAVSGSFRYAPRTDPAVSGSLPRSPFYNPPPVRQAPQNTARDIPALLGLLALLLATLRALAYL